MGTQFWWFYDVLIAAIAGGLLYNAIAKGFNKIVFRLIGCVLAFVAGYFGSLYLDAPIYNAIYEEKMISVFETACEEQDLYALTAEYLKQNPPGETDALYDAAAVMQSAQSVMDGAESPDWLAEGVGGMLEGLTAGRISPKPDTTLADRFREQPEVFRSVLTEFGSADRSAMAKTLEELYIRPDYERLVGIAAFLILEAVIAIIVGIISAMVGNKEDLMHIRKLDRPLAVPVGLVETAVWLLTLTAVIRLTVGSTDNMMILFNEETIEKTLIFKYLYQII